MRFIIVMTMMLKHMQTYIMMLVSVMYAPTTKSEMNILFHMLKLQIKDESKKDEFVREIGKKMLEVDAIQMDENKRWMYVLASRLLEQDTEVLQANVEPRLLDLMKSLKDVRKEQKARARVLNS